MGKLEKRLGASKELVIKSSRFQFRDPSAVRTTEAGQAKAGEGSRFGWSFAASLRRRLRRLGQPEGLAIGQPCTTLSGLKW